MAAFGGSVANSVEGQRIKVGETRDQSGGNAEDPLDELDLTDNIPFGKPSDLPLSDRIDRLVASNRL
jgi:hypothetical protein